MEEKENKHQSLMFYQEIHNQLIVIDQHRSHYHANNESKYLIKAITNRNQSRTEFSVYPEVLEIIGYVSDPKNLNFPGPKSRLDHL
jgi:hypothetical protein